MEYNLDFISQEDFENHVRGVIQSYTRSLQAMNLSKFNSNLIDPVKLLFDKSVFNKTFEEVINAEINRQIDKTNTNAIGYFHQNIFRYIEGCEVPNHGWDVIYTNPNGKTYLVEMKNKHNTMNSSSSRATFMRMQNQILNSRNRENEVCMLVEVIAKTSSNRAWTPSISGERMAANQQIRRVSIDKFYELITGDSLAFRKMCQQLPITIKKIVEQSQPITTGSNTVMEELNNLDNDTLIALYRLAFSTYEGF
jgi:hypothetical protein